MYSVDAKDAVQELEHLPQSCVGAPLPMVVSSEFAIFVAYIIQENDPTWDGTTCRVVGPESEGELIAIIQVVHPRSHMFGPPNDEAFSGHPLAARGLHPYGTYEVLHSSWIRTLERMNRVHPHHRPEAYNALRHFVLSFHDSTFECIAKNIEVKEVFRGSINQALARIIAIFQVS